MGSTTPRFGLYKPDPSELVNVSSQINANYDKIDSVSAKNSDLTNQSEELDQFKADMQTALDNIYLNIFGSKTRTKIPACKIRKTQGQHADDSVSTVMKFEDTTWVNEGVHAELANDQIVVDQTGIYVVTFQWTCDSAFTGRTRARITVAGTIQAENRVDMGAGGSSDNSGVCTFIGKLSNGNQVKAAFLQASGAQQTVYNGVPGTYLAVCYIGKDV